MTFLLDVNVLLAGAFVKEADLAHLIRWFARIGVSDVVINIRRFGAWSRNACSGS